MSSEDYKREVKFQRVLAALNPTSEYLSHVSVEKIREHWELHEFHNRTYFGKPSSFTLPPLKNDNNDTFGYDSSSSSIEHKKKSKKKKQRHYIVSHKPTRVTGMTITQKTTLKRQQHTLDNFKTKK
jgi:hypothetical protein